MAELFSYVNIYQLDQDDIIVIFQFQFGHSSCLWTSHSLLHNRQLCRVPKAVQPLDQLKCIGHNNNDGYNNEGQLLQLNNYHREQKSKSPDKKETIEMYHTIWTNNKRKLRTGPDEKPFCTRSTHTHIQKHTHTKTLHTPQYTRYGVYKKLQNLLIFAYKNH